MKPKPVVMCCLCKRVREDGRWLRPSDEQLRALEDQPVSHTYCAECARMTLRNFQHPQKQ